MDNQLLKVAVREHAKLEGKLSEIPDFRRWKAIGQMLEAYASSDTDDSHTFAPGPAMQVTQKPVIQPIAPPAPVRPSSKAPAIIAAAVEYLREVGHRVNSTDFATALMARGVDITGKNKAGTLSAYLSAAKSQIDNIRGEGYGLIEWKKGNQSETKTADDSQSSAVQGLSSVHREPVHPKRDAQNQQEEADHGPHRADGYISLS